METVAVANTTTTTTTVIPIDAAKIDSQRKNRIQVSNTKKPLFFYLNLAKRYMKQHDDIVLSALGMAIPTVVTIAVILKTNGVAVEKQVLTSTIGTKDDTRGRVVQKPKIEIVLEKTEHFENSKTTIENSKTTIAETATKEEAAAEVPVTN